MTFKRARPPSGLNEVWTVALRGALLALKMYVFLLRKRRVVLPAATLQASPWFPEIP